MIIIRPLIDVLGKIIKLPKNSYLHPTTLGSGTPTSTTVLYGNSEWRNIDTVQCYSTVEDEGVPLTQRNILNFVGGGVTASDVSGKTQVSIPIQQAYSTIQDEGTDLTQHTIIDFQGTGVTATNGVGKTIVTIPGNIPATNYGLFSQTANSPILTATTSEGTLIDGGVGTLSVPANGFSVGDSFQVSMGGMISAKNNDTITIRLKTGSVVLANSGPLTMPQITNQVWYLTGQFTIRALGTAGVASIVSVAQFHILKAASGTQEGFAWNTINNTTFNTTISNTLDITAQFSSNNALNSIYSDIFVLNKIY